MRVIVTGMHIVTRVHIVPGMCRMIIVNAAGSQCSLNLGNRSAVCRRAAAHLIGVMQAVVDYLALRLLIHVFAAVVPRLHFAVIVVFAVTLALVRRAVALAARVVIARAHRSFP
jgi:hypothetical protein